MTPTAELAGDTITSLPLGNAPELPEERLDRIDDPDFLDDYGSVGTWSKIIRCEMSDEDKEAMADHTWLNDQINDGAMDAYSGEYVAVVGKKLLGHHKRPHILRQEVSEATGIPVDRIVAVYVDRNLFW